MMIQQIQKKAYLENSIKFFYANFPNSYFLMFKNRKLEDKKLPKRKFKKFKEKRRNLGYGWRIFYMKGQKRKRKRGDFNGRI